MRNRSADRGSAFSTISYRHARGFFVGVDSIQSPIDLGAANDARALGTALGPALLDTIRLVDVAATRERILGELENTVQESGPGDFIVAYLCGSAGENYDDVYLHPADHDPGSYLATSVSLRLVSSVLGSAPGVKTLLILDLCYAGGVGFDLSSYRVGSESGLMVSCGPKEAAMADIATDGLMHGKFTFALTEALGSFERSAGGSWSFTLIDWFDRAYGATVRRTGGRQHPILLGTLSPNLVIRGRRIREIDSPVRRAD